MSHRSERDSSRESVKKRTTSKTRKSSKKEVRSTEDERKTKEQALDATVLPTDNETESGHPDSVSQEEDQLVEDLRALEMVLGELINRRSRGSESLSGALLPPSTEELSASDVGGRESVADERESDMGERQSVPIERQSVEDERQSVTGERRSMETERQSSELEEERFEDARLLDDERTSEVKTPPTSSTGYLKDSRLSQIVAIDDDITNEIRKVDAELKKKDRATGSIRKTSEPATVDQPFSPSASSVANSSISRARAATEVGSQYAETVEGEVLNSWFNFDSFNVPSQTSSEQTLPPSNTELIVQYIPDFSLSSPDDPFIQRTIQKILELKMMFPDESLYLIPSSSLPVAELPHLESLFEVATGAHVSSQAENPSDSSVFPGRPSFVSSSDAHNTAAGEMESLSEGLILKQLGHIIGQSIIDYMSESRPIVTESDYETPPENPSEDPSEILLHVEASPKEQIVTNDSVVAPENDADKGEVGHRARTVSLSAETNVPATVDPSQTKETAPSAPCPAATSTQLKTCEQVKVTPVVNTSADPKQSEASSDNGLKSSLKTSSATQSNVKQKPVISRPRISSSVAVEPVSLATNSSSIVKKKVSFAEMNSTMYIVVNTSAEDAATKSSQECVDCKTNCQTETHDCEDADETTSRKCSLSSGCDCSAPLPATSRSTSPSTVLPCWSRETLRPSAEIVPDATPSSQAITGSITHVMCRARSSADQGRLICGSKERWVTRVNSRSLSFYGEDAVCPSCRSDSFHSNISGSMSLRGVSPTPSDDAAVLRSHASCTNCMVNRNCSCGKERHGEGSSDSQERSSKGDSDEGSVSVSSLGDCTIVAREGQKSSACSAANIAVDKSDRKQTKNNSSMSSDE